MRLSILTILLLTAACCMAQQTPAKTETVPPITIEPLNDHLYVITLMGGAEFNQPDFETKLVASVGDDGILLVDAGFAATGEELRDSLKTLGNGKLKMIINTHYHGDHTFGNRFFKPDVPILAHSTVLDRLSGDYFNLPGPPNPNRPTVGFDDSLVIHFNGEEIHVVHTPNCHSDGDVYVYFTGSKVVAAGDLLFPDGIPYVDQDSGAKVANYIAQVKRFIDDFPDDVMFIGTHGRACGKDDLRKYHGMLTETMRLVAEGVDAGKTADQMTADSVLIDFKDWADKFGTTSLAFWTGTIVRELTPGSGWGPSICEPLTAVLVNGTGVDAIAEYQRLKETDPDGYDFREAHLNMLGYQLMMRDRIGDAEPIFKMNMKMFPESFNVYDSYGEVLMNLGDTAQSITYYERSLELNPDNANAVTMLDKLRPGP